MCVQTGMPASAHAANTGSQYRRRSWTEGSPSAAGFSEKVTARAPFAAQRSTSATARSASQSGRMTSGIRRPGTAPHHSSIIQSLYARTHARPSSRSDASVNSCPQKRGNAGKHSDASMPARSRSRTRSARVGSTRAGGPRSAPGSRSDRACPTRGRTGDRRARRATSASSRSASTILPSSSTARGHSSCHFAGSRLVQTSRRLDHVVVDRDHPGGSVAPVVFDGSLMLLLAVRAGRPRNSTAFVVRIVARAPRARAARRSCSRSSM